MTAWLERQRGLVDFTVAAMARRRGRNLGLFAAYALVVFLLASVVLFGDALRHQAEVLLADAPEVVVQGQRYRRVLRSPQTYQSLAGPLHLERHLYRPEGGRGRTICPLELRLGLLAGLWTPGAAEAASLAVSEMPPEEAAALLPKLGGMRPSRASLERLPKQVTAEWEGQREAWEEALRAAATVPPDAVTMAVSLDGVQVPMRPPQADQTRASGAGRGPGPVGYKEASCGTISFYNLEELIRRARDLMTQEMEKSSAHCSWACPSRGLYHHP